MKLIYSKERHKQSILALERALLDIGFLPPANPSVGDEYTNSDDGRTYSFDGQGWWVKE